MSNYVIVAGALSSEGDSPALKIQRDANSKLETEFIKFVHSQHKGTIYYLAISAKHLQESPYLTRMPLSAALPGSQGFSGPGMYVANRGDGQLDALFVQEDEARPGRFVIEELVASEDALRAEAEARELRTFVVGEQENEGELWQGVGELARKNSRALVLRYLAWGSTVSLLMLAAAGASWHAKLTQEPIAAIKREQALLAIDTAIRSAESAGGRTAPKPLTELDHILSIVLKEQGKLVYYQYDEVQGKSSFEFHVRPAANYDSWRGLGQLNSALSKDGQVRAIFNTETSTAGIGR